MAVAQSEISDGLHVCNNKVALKAAFEKGGFEQESEVGWGSDVDRWEGAEVRWSHSRY